MSFRLHHCILRQLEIDDGISALSQQLMATLLFRANLDQPESRHLELHRIWIGEEVTILESA